MVQNTKRKAIALSLLIVLVAQIMLLTQSNSVASARTVPSVPEFTVKIVDHSYDVPATTTTSTDPYTNETTTTTIPGCHVENKTIEVTIKNQPFTPYTINGSETEYHYNVRVKGHFGEDWTELYNADNYEDSMYPTPSDNEYTVITIGYLEGGQEDIQVEAIVGHYYDVYYYFAHASLFTVDETSGWSATQTLILDTTPPKISIESPKQAFTNSDVSISFTVNEQFNKTEYSLDGGANVTISGNTTLTDLPYGLHNVTVYAWDQAGNVGSESISFTVGVPSLIVTIIVVAVVSAFAIAIGLLVYFRRRKNQEATDKKGVSFIA